MAIFAKNFIPTTSNNGKDLIITDTSVYGGLLPKTVFSDRNVNIEKADGISEDYDFPYDNTNDVIQDVLSIEDFFDQDYIINISITWTFTNEGTPDEESLTKTYLSDINSKLCYISLEEDVDCSCDCSCEKTNTASTLYRYIEDAELWAKYSSNIKAQKFLDKAKDICDSLESGCGCN